jgi:ligand-binding sensor domain-containing protein
MRSHRHQIFFSGLSIPIFLIMLVTSCSPQASDAAKQLKSDPAESAQNQQETSFKRMPVFPQIHANLNGMVNEFVRKMYQDKNGNYWFGTNGDGLIRYNGQALEKISLGEGNKGIAIRAISEDALGNVWFGTSDGLGKYNGENFTIFSEKEGLLGEEIWGMTIGKNGLVWVGTTEGVFQYDGETFLPFELPDLMVAEPEHMLSDQLVLKFLEDKNGTMWMVTDGNGIFKYKDGTFIHLTDQNGLTDNNAADILEDQKGNIWIGTFYGGISKYDGTAYTNFTKDGIIEGVETYNIYEDSKGHIWFSAEGYGVYQYDGTRFKQFTTEDGLTTNGVQSIFEDQKGRVWFGTWQGICIYDGEHIVNASERAPWTE